MIDPLTNEFVPGEYGLSVAPMELRGDFVIHGAGDLELIRLHSDGSVTGEIENANEAGRVFMEYIRAHWSGK